MNKNRWLRHGKIEYIFHETKQFNIPEKNVPSQTCLTWVSDHFAVELNVLQGQRLHTVLHPYSALSLILRALGPAVPPPLHSNMILKMHVKYWIICLLTQLH